MKSLVRAAIALGPRCLRCELETSSGPRALEEGIVRIIARVCSKVKGGSGELLSLRDFTERRIFLSDFSGGIRDMEA